MDVQNFSTYLKEIRDLAHHLDIDSESRRILLQLIENHRHAVQQQSHWAEFFAGERAFYNHHYEVALKHYLKAAGIPQFQFFCFRASAFLFNTLQNSEKSLSFAGKALQLDPLDPTLQQLMRTLSAVE